VLIGSVFLGANLFAIDLGIAQLSIYRLMIGVVILALIYQLFTNHPYLSLNFNRKGNQYKSIYIFWFFYGLVSVLWVQDIAGWIKAMFFIGCGIFSIVIITSYIRNKNEILTILYIIFGMTAFQQLMAWYQILIQGMNIPTTVFGNQNDLATLLLAGIAVACILFLNTNIWKMKILTFIHGLSALSLILVSGSRANLVALFVFIAAIFGMFILDNNLVKKVFKLGLILLGIGVLSYIIFPPVRYYIYETVIEFFANPHSLVYRFNMIRNGFIFLASTLGFGVGAGNVEYWMINHSQYLVDAPNIHNWFMDILVGYGIFVFIAYALMYAVILRQLFVSYRYTNNHFVRNSSMILFAYLVCFMVSSLASATNIIIEWQWVFWGVIIAYVQYTEQTDDNKLLHKNQSTFET